MCQVQPAFLRRSLRTIAADLIGRPRNPSVFALIASRRSSGRARVSSGRFCIMWQVASTAQPVYIICSTGWRAPAIPFSEWLASRLTPSVLASLVAFLPLFASTAPETLPQEPLLLSAPHRRHGKICRIRQIAFQKKTQAIRISPGSIDRRDATTQISQDSLFFSWEASPLVTIVFQRSSSRLIHPNCRILALHSSSIVHRPVSLHR